MIKFEQLFHDRHGRQKGPPPCEKRAFRILTGRGAKLFGLFFLGFGDSRSGLVDEFHADGVIYENMKFCEFWSYEKVLASHILTEEMGVPCCTIEKEYALGSIGQLRTRFQAFVESLEIKKINS